MKKLDIYLQKERFKRILPYINKNDFILDIGCGNGELFEYLKTRIRITGIGIDPMLNCIIKSNDYTLIKDFFPSDKLTEVDFNKIISLAVFEHIPKEKKRDFIKNSHSLLKKGGLIVLTIPSALVDRILELLNFFKLIDGTELGMHQHHGYKVSSTIKLFQDHGFVLVQRRRFQLGLNNLFVFKRIN